MSARFAVFLTDYAKADLRDIYENISNRRTREDAALFLEALLDKVNTLQQFPRRGSIPHQVQDFGDADIRQIALQHYRIVYRVSAHEVHIVMIADSRRDMRSHFQRRLLRGDGA